MLKTIDRYVIREVVPPFLLSLLIFTFVLELPPVMEQLEQLLAKGVPWPTVGRIILLLSPQALGLTIPMALLVGLLIGLGRLSTDREAVALLACGVSPYRLLRPVMVLAGLATGGHHVRDDRAIPDANQKYREILFAIAHQEGRERHPAAGVLPGFPELGAVSAERSRARASPGGRMSSSPTPVEARRGRDLTWPGAAGSCSIRSSGRSSSS